MTLFFDTSALAKRYVEESGSKQVKELFEQADAIGVSAICFIELISAFCRLQRDKKLNEFQYVQMKANATEDFEDFVVCDITPGITEQVTRILEGNTLRGMDALHIGCAIEWRSDGFVSGDKRQIVAARNAGLNVIEV